MDFITGLISGNGLVVFFFKTFSLLFSLMLLFFLVIIYRQTTVMLKTIQVKDHGFLKRQNVIPLISFLLLIYGSCLFIFSIIILVS